MDNIQITKDCIQSINNIGSTTYQNICNGSSSVVGWGSGDWVLSILVGIILLVVIIGSVFVIKELSSDY